MLEDTARFVLNDGELCATLKALRHDLTGALAGMGIDPLTLIASRDVEGDRGTTISTAGEAARENLASIVHAAAGRTAEAVRALEESAKALGKGDAACRLEQTRYRVYDAHKRIALALGSPARRQFRLCVLLTSALCKQHSRRRVAERAIEGGADCLQLREKDLSDRELLAAAEETVSIARAHGASVFINDRPDIALLSGADGVHLGQGDLPVARVREMVGSRLLIGASTGSMEEALRAACEGADVCGVGPMFATTTKHKPVLAGPEYLRAYLADERTARVPHLAISGVTPENVATLASAGCRGVAVSSAVCGAADPRRVCEELVRAMVAVHPGANEPHAQAWGARSSADAGETSPRTVSPAPSRRSRGGE